MAKQAAVLYLPTTDTHSLSLVPSSLSSLSTAMPSSLPLLPTYFLLSSLCLCRGVKPGAGPPSVGGWGSQHIDDALGFPTGRQSEWGASRYPVQHGGTWGETGNGLSNELNFFFFIHAPNLLWGCDSDSFLSGFLWKEVTVLCLFSRKFIFVDKNLQSEWQEVFYFCNSKIP